MGSNLNFKNVITGAGPQNGTRPGNARTAGCPLSRQPSVYSLTFDEFQSNLGKDFGSMNMDEFLKNVWFAEETQGSCAPPDESIFHSGNLASQFSLQRQGSLTLPRTLSLKTVDEVFRDMFKETMDQGNTVVSSPPQRQPTLGEMTLEEFLFRAGVAIEDQPINMSNIEIVDANYGNTRGTRNDQGQSDLDIVTGLGQPVQDNGNSSCMPYGGVIDESANNINVIEEIRLQTPKQPLFQHQQQKGSWISDRYNQSHVVQHTKEQHQLQPFQEPQPTTAYGSPTQTTNVNLINPSVRSGLGGVAGTCTQVGSTGFVGMTDTNASIGVISPATGALKNGSPQPSSDVGYSTVAVTNVPFTNPHLNRSDGDNSSLSPVPYAVGGILLGRRGQPLEKVVERRQRRMIKNRESAARSRARKQAYTLELEAEISKLKQENVKLQKKQAEIMERQAQILERLNHQAVPKKRCLRRTCTGPW